MQIRDRIKSLRRVRAKELKPNPKNWRTHPEAQRNALRGVLAEIGYADALIARELKDGTLELIDGHLRAETTPDAKVPVLVLDVTAKEAELLLATLDPLSAMAEADAVALDALVGALDPSSDAVQSLLESLTSATDGDCPLIDTPVGDPPKKPTTRRGDLWQLGRHRLLCGDSRQAADVRSVVRGLHPLLMVTDPPYGVDYDPAWRAENLSRGARRTARVANDHVAEWKDAYRHFAGDVAYVWHSALHGTTVADDLGECGIEIRCQVIWRKQHFAISRGHYHWQHEGCWYGVRRGRPAHWSGDRRQSTVWDVANACGGSGDDADATTHPTQKPVECMGRPMRNHGAAGDAVFEPFAGSGSTLIAAEQLDRRCLAIEIDPAWCDVIVERWERLSGKRATKAKR